MSHVDERVTTPVAGDESQAGMLRETVARMLGDVVSPRTTVEAEAAGLDARAWSELAALGLRGADAAALGLEEQAAVLEAIGYAGALVPYAESEALARWAAQKAGFATADGDTLTLVVLGAQDGAVGGAGGMPRTLGARVPWGRHAQHAVVSFAAQGRAFLALVPAGALGLAHAANLAAEPSDRCGMEHVRLEASQVRAVDASLAPAALEQRGALLRCAAMLGAASRAQELTLQYAADRKQFGRALAQFQVIQSYLAEMACELGACGAIFATALQATIEHGSDARLEVAAAKVRIGQAARTLGALAHQVHGAIGFTQEYALHLWTRRLWAWREEYGNETVWARELGAAMVALGAEGYWERIAR